MMTITHVRVRKLVSAPYGYGHKAIEAEAEVGPDQSANDVEEHLSGWIAERIAREFRLETINRDLAVLMRDTDECEKRRDRFKAEAEAWRKVLLTQAEFLTEVARNGIKIPEALADEIPF